MEYTSFEQLLERNGRFAYTTVGGSMLPLLRPRRDIVEIQKKGAARCKKYDVVLYRRQDQYILHRIVRVTPDGYVIAGDHNAFREYDVTDAMILGVMTRVIRDGKAIAPEDWRYRVYSRLWVYFYPVRALLLKTKSKARAMARRALRR